MTYSDLLSDTSVLGGKDPLDCSGGACNISWLLMQPSTPTALDHLIAVQLLLPLLLSRRDARCD